ncbi:MAG: isopenicillin N synthase family oxygenase [Alphaproteobacteria bacterium]|nr:isopenicillin N synthase family oxygenase [Alphaproteobacteria bacterium]
MSTALSDTPPIPAIDLAPFLDGDPSGKRAVAEAVADACREIGFLVIAGHGIPQATIDRAVERCLVFYDLPQATKDRWHPTGAARQRGYHAFATRGLAYTLGDDTPPDLRETVFLGPIDDHRAHYAHIPEAATAYAPNTIPTEPEGLDHALVAIYRAYERLAADLMRVFAVALDLPEDYFAPLIDRHFSILSAHHYPALTEPPKPGQLRTGAHTDFGAMTILAMTDATGGLEARTRGGSWAPVRPGRGELVVNLGDMMERWTNDRWVSTLHRVSNPPDLRDAMSRRLSIGYFMHPNFDAEIRCIPSCLAPGETPRHPTISAGEHIRMKIEKSHDGAD